MTCRSRVLTFGSVLTLAPVTRADPAPVVTFSTVSATGYAAGDINSVSISRNDLTTYGGYQYAAYYGTNRYIDVARRTTSGGTPGAWQARQLNGSAFQLPTTGDTAITDDHNVIAMAVDGNGYMHMSWGMHNVALNMANSLSRVDLGWDTSNINFTKLAGVTGLNENECTYPEFYPVPNSKDLLFFYRNGGVGGGSGNGNEYIDRYSAATNVWSQVASPLLQGINPNSTVGYNGYLNAVNYDSKGNLQATWTWRETPDFQTNHDLLYAKSADNGVTWTSQSGTPYTLGITKTTAQIVKSIGQGNSLINNSGMTVDRDDNPVVATWWAPNHAAGDDTQQYMLEYYDGTAWQTSQITRRPAEPLTTNTAADIRQTGRPIVVVDKQNRVVVVYRDADENNNGITVAYSTDRVHWSFLPLSTTNLGQYEPSYDSALWQSTNQLDLFFQPTALGATSAPVQILRWDEAAYFAAVPEPTAAAILAGVGIGLLGRRRRGR